MIKIVMPTSFDRELPERLHEANQRHADRQIQVAELFGSLPRTPTGSGRPERSLPRIDRAGFERHVGEIRELGFGFTCLFNTSCTANREFDGQVRNQFIDELLWVRDIGATALVLASPYLIDLARRHVPDLRVHVSSIAFAKSTKEAAHYLRRGARRLILDPDTVRDFRFIRKLRRECPELELEVLCNHPCLLNCPYETYCYNSVSHASTASDTTPYEGFSLLNCNRDKLGAVVEFVKGSWFRPQDVHHYEEAGVAAIKIAGRGRSTDWLVRCAEAYLSRHYEGDMMDLVWEAQLTAVWKSTGVSGAPPRPVRVEASAFDGFIEFFARNTPDCGKGCGACRFCDGYAERALAVNPTELERARETLDRSLKSLLERPVA